MEKRPISILFVFNAVAIVAVIACLAGCTKATTGTINGSGRVVYVAGDNGNNPVLWKNGVENTLSSTKGTADQVLVWNNAVYVSGIDGESLSLNPGGPGGEYVYWKDGVANNVVMAGVGPTGSGSMAVSGNGVYYVGLRLFKNGVHVPLPGESYVQSVTLNGADLYAAGSDTVGDAVYWKNGVLHVVAHGYYPAASSGTDPGAFCIAVSGNDVYVGGYNINNMAVYWKNGIETRLVPTLAGSFVSAVNGLFVAGNDVYATAYLIVPGNGGENAPAYWKNGVEVDLPLNGATSGYARSIFVSGSDVYAAGWTSSAGAVYWKNGVETVLSTGGSANSIFVE
jgi:sulfur transfer complex TusBCD TusB component (DsrH family)